MTVVVIAHRLSTIKDADKIFVIKEGLLIEQGNHAELLENYPNGTYAGFCEKQQNAEAQGEVDGPEDDAMSVHSKKSVSHMVSDTEGNKFEKDMSP